MGKIRARVVSSAPLETLYALGRQPHLFPELFPNLKNIKILETSEDGNYIKAEWTAEARPVRKKRSMTWIQEDRWDDNCKCCRFQCAREGRGHFKQMCGVWSFKPVGDSTEMTIDMDYEMDHPLLRLHPFAVKIIDNIFRENNEALLNGIKQRAESGASGSC
ncbi:MAG TPA: SRPBCC family protein [bacterium]|nr:SRPBCC family protein [bacterium]